MTEPVVIIAQRDAGEGWRALLVRRFTHPRWALAWYDGNQLVGDSTDGVEASHEGLRSLVGDLDWTDHDTARAAFNEAGVGDVQRGHLLWQEIGQPIEAPE